MKNFTKISKFHNWNNFQRQKESIFALRQHIIFQPDDLFSLTRTWHRTGLHTNTHSPTWLNTIEKEE